MGKAMLADFSLLGIQNTDQLANADPDELYDRLCERTGVRHDICCLDVFRCAVAQARDPQLSPEKRNWWYWSRLRKSEACANPK